MPIKKGHLPREVREEGERRAKERLNSNAEYQRRNLMTSEQRGRDAIDRMTKLNIDYARKNGKELTDSQARAFATEIGHKNLRESK